MTDDYSEENNDASLNDFAINLTASTIDIQELTELQFQQALRNADLFIETYGNLTDIRSIEHQNPSVDYTDEAMEPDETTPLLQIGGFHLINQSRDPLNEISESIHSSSTNSTMVDEEDVALSSSAISTGEGEAVQATVEIANNISRGYEEYSNRQTLHRRMNNIINNNEGYDYPERLGLFPSISDPLNMIPADLIGEEAQTLTQLARAQATRDQLTRPIEEEMPSLETLSDEEEDAIQQTNTVFNTYQTLNQLNDTEAETHTTFLRVPAYNDIRPSSVAGFNIRRFRTNEERDLFIREMSERPTEERNTLGSFFDHDTGELYDVETVRLTNRLPPEMENNSEEPIRSAVGQMNRTAVEVQEPEETLTNGEQVITQGEGTRRRRTENGRVHVVIVPRTDTVREEKSWQRTNSTSGNTTYKLSQEFLEKEKKVTKKWINKIMPTLIRQEENYTYTNWTWFKDWLSNHSRFAHKLAIMASNASLTKRMETFENWPENALIAPNKLAEAGFFYLGHSDSTKCFQCAGVLANWEENEDPWELHAFFYPYCGFIMLEKGGDYIREISYKRRINSVPIEQLIFDKSSERNEQIGKVNPEFKPEFRTEAKPDTIFEQEKQTGELTQPNKNEDKNNMICIICWENKISALFLPCGHAIVCTECALSLKTCASCRTPIRAAIKIFFP